MKQTELEKLMSTIASGLRADGNILQLSNDYRITYLYLYFKDDASHLADGELFHAGRHGDDREGTHPDSTVDEAADACEDLLNHLRGWQAIARSNTLYSIYFTVTKSQAGATRYLYNVSRGVETIPDDPMIVF